MFRGDLLLVRDDGDPAVALADSPEEFGNNVLFRREIGVLHGRGCWAVEVAPDFEPPEGTVFRELRGVFSGMEENFFRMAGRAKQIAGWNATHGSADGAGARPASPSRRP